MNNFLCPLWLIKLNRKSLVTQRIDRSGLRGALPADQQQIRVVPARILMFSNVSDKHKYNKEEFKKMSSFI